VSRGRSTAVYAAAALVAVAVGAAAAMLQPDPISNTSVEFKAVVKPADPAVVREQHLETLIEAARGAEDVEHLAGFDVAVALADGDAHDWARTRLMDADVPPELAITVAKRLSRRGQGPDRAAALLDRFLAEGSAEAVDVVRLRDEGTFVKDVGCRCTFGRYRGWAVAWGEGLAWAPVAEDGWFRLNVRAAAEGPSALAIQLPDGLTGVSARGGESPQIPPISID
jgi:hypothetical protein